MVERRHSGRPPRVTLPAGAVDTQIHAYLPGFEPMRGGPGLPPDPLPTPAMYRSVMQWLGIDRVVVTQGNAYGTDNGCLLACLAEFGPTARGVAVIAPGTPEAEIARLSAGGVVGARIMDLSGGAVGLDALERVDALAADAGWMMAVQFDGSRLPELEPRLAQLQSRWVLDHHGKIFSGAGAAHVAAIKRLIDRGRMWFKFAGAYESSRSGPPDYADIARVAREIVAHAPDRVVWGTNWPHNMAQRTEDYPDDVALADTTLGWLGDAETRRRVLTENPVEIYGRWDG